MKPSELQPVAQPELFEPDHVSLQEARLRHGMPERVNLEHWQLLNKRSLSTGYTYLEAILTPTGDVSPGLVTRRDAIVAACVIQWLGTNCGHGFLREAERKIEQLQKDERHREYHARRVFPLPLYINPKHIGRQRATREIEL